MPFKSDAQRKWMWANDPEMAKRWEEKEKKENDTSDISEVQLRRVIRKIFKENHYFTKKECKMRVTKRQLIRIIKEEAQKIREDSISDELDHLRKNIEDDKEHIDNLEKDIKDDRDEMERAHDAERRKDESRRRRANRLRRIVRRTLREDHHDWGMGKDEDSRTRPGEEDYTGHKGDHSKTDPGHLDYEGDPAGRAHDAIAAIHDLASAAGVELDVTAGDVGEDDELGILALESRRGRALRTAIKQAVRARKRR